MGMSASQARLLHLTARLSDKEFQAQNLTNAKMRLADSSQEITQKYSASLDKKKLVFQSGVNGNSTVDASARLLTEFDPQSLQSQRMLVDSSGRALVSESTKIKFDESSGVFENFLNKFGYTSFQPHPAYYTTPESGYTTNDTSYVAMEDMIRTMPSINYLKEQFSIPNQPALDIPFLKSDLTNMKINLQKQLTELGTVSVNDKQQIQQTQLKKMFNDVTAAIACLDKIANNESTAVDKRVNIAMLKSILFGTPISESITEPCGNSSAEALQKVALSKLKDHSGENAVVDSNLTAGNVNYNNLSIQFDNYKSKYPKKVPEVIAPPFCTYNPAATSFYKNLFNVLTDKGARTESEANLNSSTWLYDQLQNGNLYLQKWNTTGGANNAGGFDSVAWASGDYALQEVRDHSDEASVKAEYDLKMNAIQNKDKKIDLELKQVDNEHNAVQTEVESVKKVMDKNIERSFKTFG